MIRISLTQGRVALIDDEDFSKVFGIRWCAVRQRNDWYAVTGGRKNLIRMHRLIMGVEDPKVMVDHRNHSGLDNRKENLRVCTHSQNQANSRLMRNNKSGCRGVFFCNKHKRWKVRIQFQGKRISFGYFKEKEKAVAVWRENFKKLFGEFSAVG